MQPTEIVNTVFLNSVCDLGGAGSTLALVAAILLVSKNKSNRRIAKFGFIPSLFNVNEILLFGMPIVFNPVFFYPVYQYPSYRFVSGVCGYGNRTHTGDCTGYQLDNASVFEWVYCNRIFFGCGSSDFFACAGCGNLCSVCQKTG